MDINAVIARINELAAKNKTVGLTEEEIAEAVYYQKVIDLLRTTAVEVEATK